ncbi:hypothetical protein CC1G_12612 [Coprinopsis cinerea okayama7|uniref:GST N-terminal domain-containing protein n=1 Tax=Coprinopsis cinerea (strain Okayama-7 / 130 / ATCC MYA-4618 / FGSC 9003) TaxID=240176 RepID=A8P8J5_COPC7|nr:hypothetical protein CC1G_12612 [Coprinopsis cinerea okayama7\|eukprot:XP_001839584.1 hypothetical protein CC1G_12612 [Coprinopsis cinerea okayama7\
MKLEDLDQTKITLFDLYSEAPGHAFSPSTWKVRYALNFKKLPFVTDWVDFIQVQSLCAQIGAKPTIKKPDGGDIWTLPVIYDPSTKRVVSESLVIAEYLEQQYPSAPRLIPPGTEGLIRAFVHAFTKDVMPLYQFVIPLTIKVVKEESKPYFRATREAWFGTTLEEAVPKGEKRVEEWSKVKDVWKVFGRWFGDSDEDVEVGSEGTLRKWVMGDAPCFADFLVAAHLMWVTKVLGQESEEWKEISKWSGGRWGRLLEDCKVYEGDYL